MRLFYVFGGGNYESNHYQLLVAIILIHDSLGCTISDICNHFIPSICGA